MKKNLLWSALVVISLATGCNKSDSDGKAVLEVRLTDAPAEFDQVLIDIQDVQIHSSSDTNEGEWVSLDVNEGVYNLLDFRNGMETVAPLNFLQVLFLRCGLYYDNNSDGE
jgi:hypothetical protein